MVTPWSALWDHNRFLIGRPGLEALAESAYVRGAVSGIGLVTGIAGLGELASVFAGRARRHIPDPPAGTPPASS